MRKKVMHLITGLVTGGLENVAIGLLREMAGRTPWSLELACLDDNMPRSDEMRQLALPLHCLYRRPGVDWRVPWRLVKILRNRRVDLIHCHNQTCMFYGVLAAALVPGVRVIATEHGRLFPGKRLGHWANRIMSLRVARVAAVSRNLATQMLHHDRIAPRKIMIVPNGVNLEAFRPGRDSSQVRESLALQPQNKVIGIVGRLSPVKNHSGMLYGFRAILQVEPTARLVIVGDGPLRSLLEAEARQLGVAPYTQFLGDRRDIADLMSAMDVFCLPSFSEGMSLTLLEAMATGLPVVASAVGGNPELVVDNVTGRLVSPGNHEELANAVLGILAKSEAARQMGLAARRRVEEQFSFARTVEAYDALYRQILRLPQEPQDHGTAATGIRFLKGLQLL